MEELTHEPIYEIGDEVWLATDEGSEPALVIVGIQTLESGHVDYIGYEKGWLLSVEGTEPIYFDELDIVQEGLYE